LDAINTTKAVVLFLRLCYLLPKTIKLFGFPIIWLWSLPNKNCYRNENYYQMTLLNMT